MIRTRARQINGGNYEDYTLRRSRCREGTVAKLLAEIDGSIQISTGDILRAAVRAGTELGKEAREYMERGDLVPDSLIMQLMEKRLHDDDGERGFILDGFPRTIAQAEALKKLLEQLKIKLDFAVNLEVPEEVVLDRLTTRRTCSNPDCQEIYNIKSRPPRPDGRCEKCGSPVVQRDDETREAISHRLDTYRKKTAPLIGFYEKEGMLRNFVSLESKLTVEAIREELKRR